MASKPPSPTPERQETDDSLDLERTKSDEEYERHRSHIEQDSDEAVRQTRESADQAVHAARDLVDSKATHRDASPGQRKLLRTERAQQDSVVREERRVADRELLEEREEQSRALAALLSLERDQTDEHLLVERARADDVLAARDDFMQMVSHDLRTLLSGIALHSAMLIRNAGEDEAGARTLRSAQKIQRLTARMNRLIGDLVDVASIEAGRLNVAPDRRDATGLLRECLESFQGSASANGIALTVDIKKGTPLAKFDHDRILQVLANVLSNAIKFTPEGGRIQICVDLVEAEVRFSVADTGVGIAEAQLDAIFERFWQVTAGDRRGLGLGLFISKCIVEAHGGRMWASSELGKGTTIFFTLPAEGALPNG